MVTIEISALAKSFPVGRRGRIEVLEDISFDLCQGEFVSIIGPSGSGKSTILNLLTGLESPTSGEIRFGGGVTDGRTTFAYMPQKDLLLPWRRNLANAALGLEVQGVRPSEARRRAASLFGRFGLTGFEQSYPFQLSGGMRQRVALLRTVVQGRPVLLLDEPFGALDSLTRTEMQLWLAEMCQEFGWTVLLVTHDIREAAILSDRVLVLSSRPTTVKASIEVPISRPRSLDVVEDPGFVSVEARLIAELYRSHTASGITQLTAGRSI